MHSCLWAPSLLHIPKGGEETVKVAGAAQSLRSDADGSSPAGA